MEQLENITRAYSQAPWRKQMQWIGLFLLAVVLIVMVSGVYLSISTRATAVGRDIQSMQATSVALDIENEDLKSRLAIILSSSEMEARARAIGFESVPADQIVYLNVPGYEERRPVILAPSSDRSVASAPSMPPEYSESLLEWIARQVRLWYSSISEVQP